jgi:hypothetical protein
VTLSEIRNECWDYARDTALVDSDRLWTTREMNKYINRIYRWIAKETRCIRDSQTVSLCQFSLTPRDWSTLTADDGFDYTWVNDPNSWLYHQNVAPYVFPLDSRILDIDECKLTSNPWILTKVSVTKWQQNPQWEQVIGLPTEFCTDYSNNTLAVNFRSVVSDTLRLTVRRLPLVDLISDGDVPEFRTHYHDAFINGVLHLMYLKQDAETVDKGKSDDFLMLFFKDLDDIKQQETYLDQRLKANYSLDAFR